MTPTNYAADELEVWEQALREQREAEEELAAARQKRRVHRVIELMPQVQALRTRADLLLAEAVTVKCAFSDHKFVTGWDNTTQPGTLKDGTTA